MLFSRPAYASFPNLPSQTLTPLQSAIRPQHFSAPSISSDRYGSDSGFRSVLLSPSRHSTCVYLRENVPYGEGPHILQGAGRERVDVDEKISNRVSRSNIFASQFPTRSNLPPMTTSATLPPHLSNLCISPLILDLIPPLSSFRLTPPSSHPRTNPALLLCPILSTLLDPCTVTWTPYDTRFSTTLFSLVRSAYIDIDLQRSHIFVGLVWSGVHRIRCGETILNGRIETMTGHGPHSPPRTPLPMP